MYDNMVVQHRSSQEPIYLDANDAMAVPKLFVKKINERLSMNDCQNQIKYVCQFTKTGIRILARLKQHSSSERV